MFQIIHLISKRAEAGSRDFTSFLKANTFQNVKETCKTGIRDVKRPSEHPQKTQERTV